ncbi:hypothetical protein KI387_043839 [Taxus chinensis]|uniref:Uncharacterized protein n=1 Tax=Taxus chinensis TaxID=29808 RepID=A0AA38FNB6_TAXCH|nr:hypothetical protein KI387_043839 [Taxus chinensis]
MLVRPRKNWLTAERDANGIIGPKRREPAEPAEKSQVSLKQSGTSGPKMPKPAESAEMSPEGPKSNGTSGTNGREMPEPAEMSTKGPKSNGTSGTNGGEVREGAEGAEDQSETATCPHRRKSQKVKGASYRALNRTNEMVPRVQV